MDEPQIAKLDREERDRIRAVHKKVAAGSELLLSEVFRFERTRSCLDSNKGVVFSFSRREVFPNIPFYDAVFVELCPGCGSKRNLTDILPLVDAHRLVPIFLAPYTNYDPAVVSALYHRPHISSYEHHFWALGRFEYSDLS